MAVRGVLVATLAFWIADQLSVYAQSASGCDGTRAVGASFA